MAATVTELTQKLAFLFKRVEQLESQSSGANIQGLERLHLNILIYNDNAFEQIAILGLKSGSAAERIRATHAFATAESGTDVQVHVTNEEQGPTHKREITGTTSTSSRQRFENILKQKTKSGTQRVWCQRQYHGHDPRHS